MPGRISLTMIVRNGAATLARGLNSVYGLVDEMVVVDTGSSDGTAELASRLGARVLTIDWPDSFAEARNAALDAAKGDWIFWLDADEWLEPENQTRLAALRVRISDPAVYLMRQYSPVGPERREGLFISQARLFPNREGVRWRYRIHEQVMPSCLALGLEAIDTDVVIMHSGYESESESREKDARNLRLLECDAVDSPDDPWIAYQLGRFLATTRFDEARVSLERALMLTSGRPDPIRRPVYALLARGHHAQGQRDEAERWTREGLAAFPRDAELRTLATCLAFEIGDLSTAETHALGVLFDPADDDASLVSAVDVSLRGWRGRQNLAAVYRAQDRCDDAERLWRSVVDERPQAAEAWLGLGEIALSHQRWDTLEWAVTGLEQSGMEGVALDAVDLLRARALMAQGRWDEADRPLRAVLQRDPHSIVARHLRARVLVAIEDVDAARTCLEEVLAIDPADPMAQRVLAAFEDA